MTQGGGRKRSNSLTAWEEKSSCISKAVRCRLNLFLLFDFCFAKGFDVDSESDEKLVEDGDRLAEFINLLHSAESIESLWKAGGSKTVAVEEVKSWL